MRTLSWVLAAALGAAGPVEAQLLAQVVPVKYNVTVQPGKPLARDVLVTNQGDGPVVVRIRLSDWILSEHGQISLASVGSTPNTLLGRVQYEPTQFSLQPGESGRVHVTMTMVDDGPATRWGVLLSEVRPVTFDKERFGPRAIAELGTTLYLSRVPAIPIRAEVTDLSVAPLGGDSISVSVRIRNAGERHFYIGGEMALSDSSGTQLHGCDLGKGVVLPGSEREFTWMCEAQLDTGHYLASARLDTGEPELIVGETWFRWSPDARSPSNFARLNGSGSSSPR